MKNKNVMAHTVRRYEGISLISLIITIIVIIILAAIVIFTGLNTPDSAQFAKFTQQVDNVQMAVTNKFADLKTKHSIEGRYRTDEQIYLEIATGKDYEMYTFMGTLEDNLKSSSEESTGIQNITVNGALNKEHSIGMTLPKVRESNTAWYVTKEGRVFNANGYTYNDKTYFTGGIYQEGELGANKTSNEDRAEKIYMAIKNGTNEVGQSDEKLAGGLYDVQTGTLKMSWEELTAEGGPIVVDGNSITTRYDSSTGINASSNALNGKLIIPSTVRYIDNNSPFYKCNELVSVYIPSSVQKVSYSAFSDCERLSQITVGAKEITQRLILQAYKFK